MALYARVAVARRSSRSKSKPHHWVCKSGITTTDTEGKQVTCAKNGGYRFSVITKTIFQDTKIPLDIWFRVAYLMLTSKKGISALQIHRTIFGEDSGSDYRTSWFMCHRLRCAMRGGIEQLDGRLSKSMKRASAARTSIAIGTRRRRGKAGGAAFGQDHRHRRDRAQGQRHRARPLTKWVSRRYGGFRREAVSTAQRSWSSTDEQRGYRASARSRLRSSKPSITASTSTLPAPFTRTRLNRSGRCSSAASWAATITSRANICRSTSMNLPSDSTGATIPICFGSCFKLCSDSRFAKPVLKSRHGQRTNAGRRRTACAKNFDTSIWRS